METRSGVTTARGLAAVLCLLAGASTAVIQTATNGTLSVKMDNNPGIAGKIGLFMVGTGAGHPDPGKAVFYSYANDASLGTSWITIKDDAAMVLWTNAPQGFEPGQGEPGYAIGALRSPAATQVSLGNGFRTIYPVPGLTVTQDVVIVGATIYNTSVRHTVTVRNDGGSARTVGVRILWDWMVASIDASVFRQREPDGLFTRSFTGFPLPAFRRYQVSDSDVLPTFNIFGTTEGGSLIDPPTPPDELRYASWNAASQAAWDFPVTGAGMDSAILYYWGLAAPISLAPGESRSFTQYVTTNLDAFRRAVPILTVAASNTTFACSGERIEYTISFSNAGDGTALDLTITDTLAGVALIEPGSFSFWAQPDDLGTPVLTSSAFGGSLSGPWTPGLPTALFASNPHLQWRVNRLAPGKSAVIRFAVSPAVGSTPGTLMFQSASATYLWDDEVFRGNGVATEVRGATLEKWSTPPAVFSGDTVRYTLRLTCPCNATLYNLEVWDSVPAGADAIIPLTQGGTISGTQMVFWTIPTLGPGRSAYLSYDVRMNGSRVFVFNRGWVAYDAYRSGLLEPQQRVPTLLNRTDVTLPQLFVQKQVDPEWQSPAPPNGQVNFAIGILNQFNMTMTNVTLIDTLAAGMSFFSASGAPFTVSPTGLGDVITFDIGTIGPGANKRVDLKVQLSASCSDLLNSALVYFDSLPPPMPLPPVRTNDEEVLLLRPLMNVWSAPRTVPPAGHLLTWDITMHNSASVDAYSVRVWDSLPPRTVFEACGGAPCTVLPVTSSATIVEWTLGTSPAYADQTVWLSVWIDTQPAAIGPHAPAGVFTIGGGCETLTVTSYEGWVDIAQPDIEVLKYPESAVIPLDSGVAYTLRIRGTGTDTTFAVAIVDTVPAGMVVSGCGGWDGWSCTLQGNTLLWTLPSLPPGATTEITFTATVTGPLPVCIQHQDWPAIPGAGNNWPEGWFKSRAGIVGYRPWNMNTSCVTVGDAVLSMQTLVAYASPPHGAVQTFQITVSSTGGLRAQSITVWDTLPAGMGRIACTGGISCTTIGDLVTWTVPDLAPGESAVLEATATVYEGIGCTSYAEAEYDNTAGQPRARLQGTPVCFPVLRPEIILSVRPERPIYAAGEAVTFIISWTNIGTKETDKGKIRNYWIGGSNWAMSATGWSAGPAGAGGILPSDQLQFGYVLWDSVDPAAGETGGATITIFPVLSSTGCEIAVVDDKVEFEYGYGSSIKATTVAFAFPKPTVTSARLVLSQTVTAGGVPAGVVSGGDAVVYRIALANQCHQTITNLVVWETVPAGAVYTGCGAPAGASCGPVGGMVTWAIPSFTAWAALDLTFTASITGDPGSCPAGGELVGPSRAGAAGDNSAGLPQPVAWSNPSTVALLLPCLSIDKDAAPAGESALPVVFTIEVRNTGNDTAWGVVIVDSLPAPLRYRSSVPPAVVTDAVVAWNPGPMPPGAVFRASMTAVAPDANLDYQLLNRAVARYLTATGVRRPERSDSVAVTLSAKLGLTVSPSPYDPSRGLLRFRGLRDGARVGIFSLAGVEIITLEGVQRHQLAWDGRNRSGEPVAAGIYLYATEEPDGQGGVSRSRGKFGLIR